jgi:hypothetical protein
MSFLPCFTGLQSQKSFLDLFIDFIFRFFFHMFTVKRPHRQTNRLLRVKSRRPFYAENVTPLLRLNFVTSWVLYFSPFRYQYYWLAYRSNVSVKCLAQEHNIEVIFARRSPTLNQIRLDVAYLL